jgi:hypothetical protein
MILKKKKKKTHTQMLLITFNSLLGLAIEHHKSNKDTKGDIKRVRYRMREGYANFEITNHRHVLFK